MSIELRKEINALMVGMRESQLQALLKAAKEIVAHPEKAAIKPDVLL